MSRLQGRLIRPILLAAGIGSSRPNLGRVDEAMPCSWQVDETTVAFARAAISRGIPLAVPIDGCYAPLVAQIASEYLSPRVAEGESQTKFEGERGDGLRAVSLVSIGQKAVRSGRQTTPGWTDLFRDLKVVSDSVLPLREFMEMTRPLGVVGIGQGSEVSAFLSAARETQMHHWRLAASLRKGNRRQSSVESFENGIERELVSRRKELVILSLGESSRLKASHEGNSPEPPPFFHHYPPLALYAQMLVDELVANGGKRNAGSAPLS